MPFTKKPERKPMKDDLQGLTTMPERTTPAKAISDHETFLALQGAARAWRCWDRTESMRVEDRIVDGAAWGILYAMREGKIPGISVTMPAPTSTGTSSPTKK